MVCRVKDFIVCAVIVGFPIIQVCDTHFSACAARLLGTIQGVPGGMDKTSGECSLG